VTERLLFSRWPIILHDRVVVVKGWQLLARQLSSLSTLAAIVVELYTPDSREYFARILRAVVLGFSELNCDWLRIPTSQKSFLARVRRRYFRRNQ